MKRSTLLKALLVGALVCSTAVFAAETTAVKGNPDSKVYHKPSCKHYTAKGSTKEFSSEAEATKAGYKGCKKCSGKKKEADKK